MSASTCARWRPASATARPARCSPTPIAFLRSTGFDLVLVETAGIGQSDSEIVDLVDVPVYVMTSEFGAASQLEKIDMLDLAEIVVINKFDKRGAEDALRDVRKQWKRNHVAFELSDDGDTRLPDRSPASSTIPALTWMFANLCGAIGRSPGRRCGCLGPGADRARARAGRRRPDPGQPRALSR